MCKYCVCMYMCKLTKHHQRNSIYHPWSKLDLRPDDISSVTNLCVRSSLNIQTADPQGPSRIRDLPAVQPQ